MKLPSPRPEPDLPEPPKEEFVPEEFVEPDLAEQTEQNSAFLPPDELEPPRIGINGFERVGRMVLMAAFESGLEIQAINDPFITAQFMAYGLKFDAAHANKAYHKLDFNVRVRESEEKGGGSQLIVNGKSIHVFDVRDAAKIPWQDAGVNYVVETSEALNILVEAKRHLRDPLRGGKIRHHPNEGLKAVPQALNYGGCQKVFVAGPASDAPLFAVGVNDHLISRTDRVIGHVSPAASCLAPVLHLLHRHFGVRNCSYTLMKSIRTGDGKGIKVPSLGPATHARQEKWDYAENLVPVPMPGLNDELLRVLPWLQGRLSGLLVYVPTPEVSLVTLTLTLNRKSDDLYRDVCLCLKEAASSEGSPYRTVLRYLLKMSEESNASSVFAGETHSAIVDGKSGSPVNRDTVLLSLWFDNEFGFAHRLIDLVTHSHVLQAKYDQAKKDAQENGHV